MFFLVSKIILNDILIKIRQYFVYCKGLFLNKLFYPIYKCMKSKPFCLKNK